MALIYIVEDDTNILEIEEIALKNSGYEEEGFVNAKDFFDRIAQKKPDLVLLDIMLPDMDGLSIVKKIRSNENTNDVPVIILTAKTSEIDKVKGLDCGADDYMTKPFGVMELISRVKALLRRSRANKKDSAVYMYDTISMDDDKHLVTAADSVCELTYKEYELLKLLLMNAGIVVSRDRILESVWGTDYEGESRTLDMHMKTLRQKLGDSGSLIRTVRNVGYILSR
jgi:two-component system alkaline phosphatase synthesis response regulator PhoP